MRAIGALVCGVSCVFFAVGPLVGGAEAQTPPASSSAPAAARPAIQPLRLTNASKREITAVYFAKPGTTDWSDDLLGKQTAGPGKIVTLKIHDPDGICVFDLQFLMANGDVMTKSGVNVCDPGAYTFSP